MQVYFDLRFLTFNRELHIHHFFSFGNYFLVIFFDQNYYMSCCAIILEISTPFSCICYCLIKSGMSKSFMWKANQFVLIHVFHMRSLVEFGFLYDMFKNWNKWRHAHPSIVVFSLFGLITAFVYLTPFWTYKKTEQLFTNADRNAKAETKEQAKTD